jgi:hypothetical protein
MSFDHFVTIVENASLFLTTMAVSSIIVFSGMNFLNNALTDTD